MILQDNIHPPDLILHNPTLIDSPLSTPPDSPRRAASPSIDISEEEEKKEEEKLAIVGDDNDSLPDDEKNAPIGDELMAPMRATEKENVFEEVRLKPATVNVTKKIPIEEDSHDEPPSLSIVENARNKLSRRGLSFSESDSPSSNKVSPKNNSVNVDISEPPSLSRVQEAMQRTSRMVEKHNQRDRNNRNSILREKPIASTTAAHNVDNAVKSSESKLEALQRDIMSLKMSLSDMNMGLKKDQMEAPKVDEYNDIPFLKASTKQDADITAETESMSEDKLPSLALRNTESVMDAEVAAITANSRGNISVNDDEPPSLRKTEKISRKLDYGDMNDQPMDEHDELMGPSSPVRKSVYDYKDIQHEMKKFASQTREALREESRDQSFTDFVEDPSPKVVPSTFSSPIAVERSMDNFADFEMNAIAQPTEAISINFAAVEAGEIPKMLISMDSFDGIASGDIFLSLLSENTGRDDTSAAATWADRVHSAIWRARRMRKTVTETHEPRSPKRSFKGGSQTVESVQKAALKHLKRNEIDDAISLVEGIVFAYYSYFERTLKLREQGFSTSATIDFKPYIGMGLHNLGILNLLKGEYEEALSYFNRAVENRRHNLGENHPLYIVSATEKALFMTRMVLCVDL